MKSVVKHQSILEKYLADNKIKIDAELFKILTEIIQPSVLPPNGFEATTIHSVLKGGKRLRPILTVATYQMNGGTDQSIYTAACAMELIHAGSLMLDDLPCMDNADYRRGEPTSHKLFGESTTILASASLWVSAFDILSEIKNENALRLIKKTSKAMGSRGLIQGQLLDLASFNETQNINELEECYRLKTGVLFSLATVAGAILAGAPRVEEIAMEKFGEQLGIAFQIRDDIIDATQTILESGKDARKDQINNKPSYVSILGVEGAKKALNDKLDSCSGLLAQFKNQQTILQQLTDSLKI